MRRVTPSSPRKRGPRSAVGMDSGLRRNDEGDSALVVRHPGEGRGPALTSGILDSGFRRNDADECVNSSIRRNDANAFVNSGMRRNDLVKVV